MDNGKKNILQCRPIYPTECNGEGKKRDKRKKREEIKSKNTQKKLLIPSSAVSSGAEAPIPRASPRNTTKRVYQVQTNPLPALIGNGNLAINVKQTRKDQYAHRDTHKHTQTHTQKMSE